MQQMLLLITTRKTQTFIEIGGITCFRYTVSQIKCYCIDSNGSSNSSIQLNVPKYLILRFLYAKTTTNYQIFGTVTSTTVPN